RWPAAVRPGPPNHRHDHGEVDMEGNPIPNSADGTEDAGGPRRVKLEVVPGKGATGAPVESRAFPTARQIIGIPLNVALFLFLKMLGWGSIDGFFSHPVRVGVVVLHLIMIPVMTFSTSGRSKGLLHTPDW